MKILISGNLGFVGTVTQQLLESEGHEVIGFDLMEHKDVRDQQQLENYIGETTPDRILHLAAIARFSDADKDPLLAFETNVIGTMNVALVAAKFHLPVVYASTGSAIMPLDGYETPYKEDIPARGNSVYGTSKAIGEYYIQKYAHPHIILRYSHLYGKEKRGHGLVGGFIDRIQRGLEPRLMGGLQTNDFLYVKDVAVANKIALEASWDKWNNIYHIGTGHELSAKEAGEAVCKVMKYEGKVEVKEPRTVDPGRFCFDITKAKDMLGFESTFSFEEGLEDMML